MRNTHKVSFDWGSIELSTSLSLSILCEAIRTKQVCLFDRYKSDGTKSEIVVNMKLVGCIYPLEQ